MCEFFREKSQIYVLSTFDQGEFLKNNYFDENVYSVREREIDCKVLKFKCFSSVTRNVSVKHPILNLNLFQKHAKIEKCPPNFFS